MRSAASYTADSAPRQADIDGPGVHAGCGPRDPNRRRRFAEKVVVPGVPYLQMTSISPPALFNDAVDRRVERTTR